MSSEEKKSRWQKTTVKVENPGEDDRFVLVSGRVRWALECLIKAGAEGCTPIDTPGPRWSDYVFRLRAEGVQIDTITEKHEGPFAGTHARYVLKSRVSPVMTEVAA